MTKERNSNYELLRIFAVFGIVCMHSFGSVAEYLIGTNQAVYLLVNSIFDTGVTCFILISGYYGIRLNAKKMLSLAFMVLFYSLCGIGCSYLTGAKISMEDLVKAFVPILSRKYWFVSCYFWLAALSPFLNKIPISMKKSNFEKLLCTLLLLFSVIPTFLYFEIMQDSGRGMAHMILIYLLGRYLNIYKRDSYKKNILWILLIISVSLTFMANLLLTILTGKYFAPFTRNCSLTIIISSIALFLLFGKIRLQKRRLNVLASNVLAIYVFERSVRGVLDCYVFSLEDYADKGYFICIVLVYALAVVGICIIIEMIRKMVFGRLILLAANALEAILAKGCRKLHLFFETR